MKSNKAVTEYFLNEVERRKYIGLAIVDGDGVLVVSRRFTVLGSSCPSVAFNDDVLAAHVNHWLDGDAHAVLDERSGTAAAVVRHVGILVQFFADTMSAEFTHDAVASLLTEALNGVANVPHPISGHSHSDTFVERLLGCAQELDGLGSDVAHGICVGRVAVVTGLSDGTAIN